jgi:hypothetical protein
MRFLAVGRSLGAVGNTPSRYRMNAQGLLPKFGRQTETRSTAANGTVVVPEKSTPFVAEAKTLSVDKPTHSIAAQSQQRQPSGGARLWKWLRFTNRFRSRHDAARAAGPPVQAELALDMVRPVRNELDDTDFEIVAAPKPKIAPAPVQQAAAAPLQPGKPGVKMMWGRVRGRLFGAAQTPAR